MTCNLCGGVDCNCVAEAVARLKEICPQAVVLHTAEGIRVSYPCPICGLEVMIDGPPFRLDHAEPICEGSKHAAMRLVALLPTRPCFPISPDEAAERITELRSRTKN